MNLKSIKFGIGFTSIVINSSVSATGSVIDKVYQPYVQPLEKEFEYRLLVEDDKKNSFTQYTGYGQSLSERSFVEGYIISEREPGQHWKTAEIEIEYLYQLTEQGEYAIDWGLLAEVERNFSDNAWEGAATLLFNRDFQRFSALGNFSLIYEGGGGINNEYETAFKGQIKYRYIPVLEPALEIFLGDGTKAIGPNVLGQIRLGGGKKLFWQSGVLFGASDDTADYNLKFVIEYEFF